MSDCTFTERLSAFHDGELDAAAAQRIENHLPHCAACREALRELGGLSNLLATATALQSAAPSQAIMSRIHSAVDASYGATRVGTNPSPAFSMRIAPTGEGRVTPAMPRRGAAGVLGVIGWLSAVAASLLIIGMAWLLQVPAQSSRPATPGPINVATAPAWERLATNLQPDPIVLPDTSVPADESQSADSTLAAWILSGLDQGVSHSGK